MSARNWCGCRPRRCGTRAASRRARSCCGCSRPRRPTAGPSCPAASAGSPISPMPARCRWATARGRPMSGWSPTRRFRRRRCCRPAITCGSGASPAWCRAAPPTICSGSAAISSAPRRRCGWCGRSAPQRDPGKGSPTVLHSIERIQRLLVTWGATSQASRSQPARSRPKRCRARKNSARRCRWCARRSAPRPRCASGCRRTPGRSSPK